MTITRSVQLEFLDEESKRLICLPCRASVRSIADTASAAGIANASASASGDSSSASNPQGVSTVVDEAERHFSPIAGFNVVTPGVIVMAASQVPAMASSSIAASDSRSTKGERWTEDEHERFLLGMELFSAGPWKKIAGVVGTRDARQTMSHAQKYRQKIKRRREGLPDSRSSRRISSGGTRATTRRLRTTTAVASAGGTGAGRTKQNSVSSAQYPREDLGDTLGVLTGATQPSELLTGRVSSAIGHPSSSAMRLASEPRTLTVEVVRALSSEQNQQPLDGTLEPLDLGNAVMNDSWSAPEELWCFLEGSSRG
ncbi:hypothetical protein BBJ28_00007954 [Nothophytophthora sp. Chile5]|nr:hypothetical protein BBJ28_00007954 [Nothophytophthora sp. Chile5]